MARPRTFIDKFGDAFRGIARAVPGQSSFAVHIPAALGTLALAAVLRVSLIEWCVLAGAIGAVLAAAPYIARGAATMLNNGSPRRVDVWLLGAVLGPAVSSPWTHCRAWMTHLPWTWLKLT